MNRARELADYLDEVREDGLTVVPMLPGDMELAAKALRSYEADQPDTADAVLKALTIWRDGYEPMSSQGRVAHEAVTVAKAAMRQSAVERK